MANRYSPGCCCDDCRVFDYLAPFDGFTAAEGTHQTDGPYSIPVEDDVTNGPGSSVSSRLSLAATDTLGPPPGILSDPDAFYHEIETDGDLDLTWDGGTIQLRPSAGTVTAGGQTVPIIADGESRTHTRLVLYVTPTWYAVLTFRLRSVAIATGGTRIGSTRSSIQQIDRTNTPANYSATLTAATGGCNVYAWRLADASVRADDPAYGYAYGDLATICPRPAFPMGTERAYLHQTTDPTDGLFGDHPATLAMVGDIDVTVSEEVDCTGGPINYDFSDSLPGSFRGPDIFSGDWTWADVISGNYTGANPPLTGPPTPSPGSYRSADVECCPCNSVNQRSYAGANLLDLFLRGEWASPTPENRYPKIQQKATLTGTAEARSPIPAFNESVSTLAPYNAAGKAPATTQLTYTGTASLNNANTVVDSATVSWATE